MAEDKAPETETTDHPPQKGGIVGKLPLIGGVAAGLALGAVVGLLILGPRLSASPAQPAAARKVAVEATEGKAKKGEAPLPMYQMDNLVVNPAASGGTHFLLMSVALEVKDAASVEAIKGREAEMRDSILRLFGSKTTEQVAEASSRDQLRTELQATLDKMFGAGTVRKVYFPQFVIQ